MDKRLAGSARITVRCLYPEPGTAGVKDELVGLMPAAEVHCGEDLDVEEVGEVLLEVALSVVTVVLSNSFLIVSICILIIGVMR